jgi:hypothetical protein
MDWNEFIKNNNLNDKYYPAMLEDTNTCSHIHKTQRPRIRNARSMENIL